MAFCPIGALLRDSHSSFACGWQEGAGEGPGSYRLVAQFPRRVLGPQPPPPSATLAEAGLAAAQELLLLEPLRP